MTVQSFVLAIIYTSKIQGVWPDVLRIQSAKVEVATLENWLSKLDDDSIYSYAKPSGYCFFKDQSGTSYSNLPGPPSFSDVVNGKVRYCVGPDSQKDCTEPVFQKSMAQEQLHSPSCSCDAYSVWAFKQFLTKSTAMSGVNMLTGQRVSLSGDAWCLNIARFMQKPRPHLVDYRELDANRQTDYKIIRFTSYEYFFQQVDKWSELYTYLKDKCPNPLSCEPIGYQETIPDYFRYIIFPFISEAENDGSWKTIQYQSGNTFKSALDYIASKNFNCDTWYSSNIGVGASIIQDDFWDIADNVIEISSSDLTIKFPNVYNDTSSAELATTISETTTPTRNTDMIEETTIISETTSETTTKYSTFGNVGPTTSIWSFLRFFE